MQIKEKMRADNQYSVRDVFSEHGELLKTLVEKSILDEIESQMEKINMSQLVCSVV